jgi:site-specific DNA recombinase
MLHGMLAVINEYSSHQNGEDVRYKMGMKAKNGGTISRAPIGYLNTVEHIEDRRVKTVVIDPVRGPLIRLAFELYATDDWTLLDLTEELYERGLRMPRNSRYPERQISDSRLSDVLRDDYYIGWITYDGEKIRGRHEPLVNGDLFERVQQILNSRSQADERRREHHHYLKGSLFCGACLEQRGEQRRLILQHATNRHGTTYRYFFCTGRYDHTCELPYLQVARVEAAVEAHYATIRFDETFIAETGEYVTQAVAAKDASARLLHEQLTAQLKALDVKESNLIDLAADGSLPQGKIRAKLHDITLQRDRLTARLCETTQDLSEAAALVELCLELLRDPQGLYLRCTEDQRRLLNQALFEVLYVNEEPDGELTVTYRLQEPFAELQALRENRRAQSDDQLKTDNSAPFLSEGGAATDSVGVLLGGAWIAKGSNRRCVVALIEALSHPCYQVKRLLELALTWEYADTDELPAGTKCRTARQLRQDELDHVVAGYHAGKTVYQLATKFGIDRRTVGRLLRKRGVDTTPPGLQPDEVLAAIDLYRTGWSLARIGNKYGIADTTVRVYLMKAGVTMRRPRGRR